ncbi:hypothetical protein FZI96_28155 [Mycobacterium sp. CBMA311]|nr:MULTISPECIES: hypothetical protein [unclassified Mycolicibacterium]MUL58483.1 hypothetical protein [Mycolicibacterium sp. CBMA 335]MUL73941.1 hypothetical protein [Mycolicibacterium sp. CBMA 311]MUM04582.1 hypothetical protein [Mycolicibacterium sp. CBMA 213]
MTESGDATDPDPFVLPAQQQQKWKECVYAARSCELVLSRVMDPRPGSDWAKADLFYPWEKVSVWVRDYLRASAEHLCLWADIVAPFRFEPDAINHARMRPYLSLARAALESAAHALWLSEVDGPQECLARFLRLMHHDFAFHKKALEADNMDTTAIDQRIVNLKARVDEHAIPVTLTDKVPGYERLVRLAATATDHDPNRWAYLWQTASGAAHGQNWFGIETHTHTPVAEYEQGHFRTITIPDPEFITDTVRAASDSLQWGTVRWLLMGRHSPELIGQATVEIYQRMPKLDGSAR